MTGEIFPEFMRQISANLLSSAYRLEIPHLRLRSVRDDGGGYRRIRDAGNGFAAARMVAVASSHEG